MRVGWPPPTLGVSRCTSGLFPARNARAARRGFPAVSFGHPLCTSSPGRIRVPHSFVRRWAAWPGSRRGPERSPPGRVPALRHDPVLPPSSEFRGTGPTAPVHLNSMAWRHSPRYGRPAGYARLAMVPRPPLAARASPSLSLPVVKLRPLRPSPVLRTCARGVRPPRCRPRPFYRRSAPVSSLRPLPTRPSACSAASRLAARAAPAGASFIA